MGVVTVGIDRVGTRIAIVLVIGCLVPVVPGWYRPGPIGASAPSRGRQILGHHLLVAFSGLRQVDSRWKLNRF